MHYMMKECTYFLYVQSNTKPFWEIPRPGEGDEIYVPQSHSFRDIFRAVQKNEYGKDIGIGASDGYPGVSKTTVQEVLDEMVGDSMLEVSGKTREFPRKRLYRLSSRTLVIYFGFLFLIAVDRNILNKHNPKRGRLVLKTKTDQGFKIPIHS